jgi:hypothetical protein
MLKNLVVNNKVKDFGARTVTFVEYQQPSLQEFNQEAIKY